MNTTDDSRVKNTRQISSPAIVIGDGLQVDDNTSNFIQKSRQTASDIIHMRDDRLLVVTGPCSIHNPEEAIELAERLLPLRDKFENLEIIMRTYFEKPRTTIGWKGLINDPNLDGSCDIEKGIRIARKLLLDINKLGIPVSTELLDTISPQYIGDLITWAAIGARTTESQLHRELASATGAVVGFKNGTNGSIEVALDAIGAALKEHSFLGTTKEGNTAIIDSTGNEDSHIILRGGKGIRNYTEEYIIETTNALNERGFDTGIMVDFSHANSLKDHEKQPEVCEDIANQIGKGNKRIVAVMIESNDKGGNQPHNPNTYKPGELEKGVSITDECIPFEVNEELLAKLDEAVGKRKAA